MSDNKKLLYDGINELGLVANDKIVDDFFKFKDLLIEWNEKINLTGITDEKEIVVKHFLDSLSCLTLPIDFSDKKVLDLGTGAGFPGVPLKIYDRSIDIDLFDSLNKRIKYLMLVGEELEFEKVKYSHMRAEDGAKKEDMRGCYDIVVSRAVANLSTLCEYCLPFVKEGGYFIAQKGPKCEDEIEAAKNAVEILGGQIEQVVEVKIPYSENTHFLLMIKKIKETPAKYPRRSGVPSKSPL